MGKILLVFRLFQLLATLLQPALVMADPPPTLEPDGIAWEFELPNRIVAIGDIHADARALIRILNHRRLINRQGNWIGGDSHLVLMGDLFNRGPNSRALLNLVIRLQQQASQAGGQVHALIGNHELMLFQGILVHSTNAEMEGYSDFQNSPVARQIRENDAFYNELQSGFLAALTADSPYGRFMASRNAILRIGDSVFVHAGLGDWATSTDPARVNATARAYIRASQERWSNRQAPLLDRRFNWVVGERGPMWSYEMVNRARDGDLAFSNGELQRALQNLHALRVIVGHAQTPSRDIEFHLEGKVIQIDTAISSAYADIGGQLSALEIIRGDVQNPQGLPHSIDAINRIPRPNAGDYCGQMLALMAR